MWRLFFPPMCLRYGRKGTKNVEGKSSIVADVIDRSRLIASWVSILQAFRGLPIDVILHKWRKAAFSLVGALL